MNSFKKQQEVLQYQGNTISLHVGSFTDPSGVEFKRDIIHHPGAVTVVALKDDGDTVLMVRQYRAAVESELLEIIAGKRDVEGEDPLLTAKRELEEEAGVKASHWQLLGQFYNSPGFSDEHSYSYLATGLTQGKSQPHGIEEQYMKIEEISLAKSFQMIQSGQITDAKTIIGLFLAEKVINSSSSQ